MEGKGGADKVVVDGIVSPVDHDDKDMKCPGSAFSMPSVLSTLTPSSH